MEEFRPISQAVGDSEGLGSEKQTSNLHLREMVDNGLEEGKTGNKSFLVYFSLIKMGVVIN